MSDSVILIVVVVAVVHHDTYFLKLKLRLRKVRQLSQDHTAKLRFILTNPGYSIHFSSTVPDRIPVTSNKYLLNEILVTWDLLESG